VPAAWIVGRKLLDRAAAWLFRITGETPRNIREVIGKRAVEPLKQADLTLRCASWKYKQAAWMVILATKS